MRSSLARTCPHIAVAKIEPDDEGVASSKAALSEKLGVLEVVMRSVDRYVENETYYSVGKVSRIGPAHEKSKKAGAHAVS